MIEFIIPKSEHFLDPSEIFLYFKCQIMLASGTAGTQVAPINAFFYSLFDRVEVTLNGVPLSGTFQDCPYKAFFLLLFTCPKDVKKTALRTVLWAEDTYGFIKERALPPANNKGLETRYQISCDAKTEKNQIFEMQGRPMHDFFFLNSLIIPFVEIRIRLFRKPAAFCLVTPADDSPVFNINLTDIKLQTRHIRVSAKAQAAIERKLATSPATYCNYGGIDVKARTLPKDQKTFALDNFFNSEALPDRVTFALVTQENYLGTLKSTPFTFENFGLQEIALIIDNEVLSYKVDFANGLYMELYTSLYTQLGMKSMDCTPSITYDAVGQALTFFPFDLTATHNTDDLQPIVKKNVRVELKFRTFLTEPLQLLIFPQAPFLFTLDKNRTLVNHTRQSH
jgi:hypothetical protein